MIGAADCWPASVWPASNDILLSMYRGLKTVSHLTWKRFPHRNAPITKGVVFLVHIKMQNQVKLENHWKTLAIGRLVSRTTGYISLRRVTQEKIRKYILRVHQHRSRGALI